jgi:hypothetical protein
VLPESSTARAATPAAAAGLEDYLKTCRGFSPESH